MDSLTKHQVYLSVQDTVTVHTKIRPKDVPGTLLNVVSSGGVIIVTLMLSCIDCAVAA